ncbi:MAG: TetR/AcrR family transcriptional regulator [Microthrixaceae bacterium]
MANAVVRKGGSGVPTRDRGRPPKLPEHVRRAVVLDAAVERFAQVGRAGATIDEIAAASGVRKPGIYEMFGTKDDLYRAAVDKEVGELSDFFRVVNAETGELPRPERTRRRVDAALARAEAHPAAFQLLSRAQVWWPDDDPDAGRALRHQLVGVIADNYRRESQVAGTPIDAAAELLAQLFFAMTEQIIHLRRDDPGWDRAVLVDFLADFIDGGLSGVRPEVWLAVERAHTSDDLVS